MLFGLFGKLQAKRDFIAVRAPRNFLSVFEPWLQSGLTTSRMSLGPDWQNVFLTSPIWRFWLGADLCGLPVAGALMPSMDGVGRYSPLACLAFAEADDYLPPPDVDACDGWFVAIEDFLLSTLDPAQSFEQTTQALDALAAPSVRRPAPTAQVLELRDRGCLVARGGESFVDLFGLTRSSDPMKASAGMTYWWTAGGEGFPATALASLRMPDPYVFASMLTGKFSAPVAQEEGARDGL